ncbi:tryptophan-rich sensory protein [Corynebacterium tapiri]|uniref:NAD-dependent epimerase/dehydratase family protein n=1 Tax=Corynebacterium tapiri TaxID=1448266 RepID=A0A5C4U404_9CORY|nr:tryptophan-rich sensory protein [Corynebacterium tapiri]TNL97646.1 NAD-dependent epimerase/dehydratase family protein [Corynebacterium tapiri]
MNEPKREDATRHALVTGATGYIGSKVVSALIEQGWAVRAFSRSRDKAESMPYSERIVPEHDTAHAGEVEVFVGDASSQDDLRHALEDVDVAWYLLHSMGDSEEDFVTAERNMAQRFISAAEDAQISRVVYLGGLHPDDQELSAHLVSRVKVGQVFLESSVPAACLQAGVVIGEGSSSFTMLRHAAERLPGVIGPDWIRNQITPIAVDDAIFYLTRAANLPAELNRTFDIGGPDTLAYSDMLKTYSRVTKLPTHPVVTAPILNQQIAARGLALVTPIDLGLINALMGSLLHHTVVKERDLEGLVGQPEGGNTAFAEAIAKATEHTDTRRWFKVVAGVGSAVAATAVAGSVLTKPDNRWYKRLRKPAFQPPAWVFPEAWSALYLDIAGMSSLVIADHLEKEQTTQARSYATALGANLVLNAGWCGLFFRARRPWLSTAGAGALALSSLDLTRRTWKSSPERGAVLSLYAAWTTFATVLSGAIAAKNEG